MKILTICIPTYKRPKTLQRCIESISSQIEKYNLTENVNIYVANDASPDDTVSVMDRYESLSYFEGVTRNKNLGMNINIKVMLQELSKKSDYQLIITDDDYLQLNVLNEIVEFLKEKNLSSENFSAIWTPRYSYTEVNELHTVACSPFSGNKKISPSVKNVGKYMSNGFILSGIILQAKLINYKFWEEYDENAYFPILFFGELILRSGAYYWDKNIVHHTVLNECHWDRWGGNETVINFRLFSDYTNSYSIMAKHIGGKFKSSQFYFFSFSSVLRFLSGRIRAGKSYRNKSELYSAIKELKNNGYMDFGFQIKFIMLCVLLFIVNISVSKIIITNLLLLVTYKKGRREHYFKRIKLNVDMLKGIPVIVKSVFL